MTRLTLVPDLIDPEEAVEALMRESYPLISHIPAPEQRHLERPSRAWCGAELLGIEATGDFLVCGRCVMLAVDALDVVD